MNDLADSVLKKTIYEIETLNKDIAAGVIPGVDIDKAIIPRAVDFIKRIYRLASDSVPHAIWHPPVVITDGDGAVYFEWQYNKRALSIFVDLSALTYLKSWGASINNDMEDGTIITDGEIIELWKWLVN